jgi:hypothetical protein
MAHKLPTVQRQSIEDATNEAIGRALDYDPKVRAQYVRKTLENVTQWISRGDTDDTIKARIPEFVEAYPHLYKKLIEKQDLTPIQSMIKMLDKMATGQLSQHDASVMVGKQLVDRYVTPQLQNK